MPRFIINRTSRSPKHDAYVKRLVRELTGPTTNVQPLILEENVPATKSRHVHVIWDRWKNVDDEERSSIIEDAYAQAEPEIESEITVAAGVTAEEALALGLLPYKVVAAPKKANGLSSKSDEEAVAEEARKTLLGPKARELRYARIEDAQDALHRLQRASPLSSWTIIQELATES